MAKEKRIKKNEKRRKRVWLSFFLF